MTHEIKTQQGDILTSQIQTDMKPFSVLQNMLKQHYSAKALK